MAVCLKNKRGENIIPWNEFEIRKENQNSKDKCNEPEWWEAYQNVKHFRTEIKMLDKESYKLANQKNVIFSLAGLYCLERLVQDKIYKNGKELYEKYNISCDDLAYSILINCESMLFYL